MLDISKLRLTQPQVELQLGLSLAIKEHNENLYNNEHNDKLKIEKHDTDNETIRG
jgi:hypothetical protein